MNWRSHQSGLAATEWFRSEIPLRAPEKHPSGGLSVAGQGPTALAAIPSRRHPSRISAPPGCFFVSRLRGALRGISPRNRPAAGPRRSITGGGLSAIGRSSATSQDGSVQPRFAATWRGVMQVDLIKVLRGPASSISLFRRTKLCAFFEQAGLALCCEPRKIVGEMLVGLLVVRPQD